MRCIGECEPRDFPFWHSIARGIKSESVLRLADLIEPEEER